MAPTCTVMQKYATMASSFSNQTIFIWANADATDITRDSEKLRSKWPEVVGSRCGATILDFVLNPEKCTDIIAGKFHTENGLCVNINPPDNFTVKASGPFNSLSVWVDVNLSDNLPITDVKSVSVSLPTRSRKGISAEKQWFYAQQ